MPVWVWQEIQALPRQIRLRLTSKSELEKRVHQLDLMARFFLLFFKSQRP